MAFGESSIIGNSTYTWDFGKESIAILQSCFQKTDHWNLTQIGPIMLHFTIYFLFVDNTVGVDLPIVQTKDGDIYVFFPYRTDIPAEETIELFFRSVVYPVKNHYGDLLIREEIIYANEDFRNKFKGLLLHHRHILGTTEWNPIDIIKRNNHARQLRDGIREAYMLYTDIMQMTQNLAYQKNCQHTRLMQDEFLVGLNDYFIDQFSDVGNEDYSPMLQGLRFLEEEARLATTFWSNLQAAVIGALVASVVYLIASAV